MTSELQQSEVEAKERGTLPDAPLAMPKQVLTAPSAFSLRKLFAPRAVKTGH